jgi:chitinase
MKKKMFLFLTMALAITFASCDEKNNPDKPTFDTTYVDKVDTVFSEKLVLDTIKVDTILTLDTIDLDNDRVIIGYVASYLKNLPDPFLNTHLCYAFAKLNMSADSVYLGFEVEKYNRFRSVVKLKEKNPNLKIQLSFNNSAPGGGFSRMTSVPEYRKKFAQDCLDFIKKEGIDGIDLDWEFPGMAFQPTYLYDVYNDVDNYTKLFKEIRETIGWDYLLTYAAAPRQEQKYDTGGSRYVDNKAVEPYVNWINLMTYDFCSTPQPHNAMICTGYWDIQRTFRSYYTAKYPLHKCVLGIPFYGRHEFENDKEWYYKEIEDVLIKSFPTIYQKKYNETWKVPYLVKNGEMWCSYDDPSSIAYKGTWLLEKGMKGLMYWEIEGDNARKDLQRACWRAMKEEIVNDTVYNYHIDSVMVVDTIYVPVKDTVITQNNQ